MIKNMVIIPDIAKQHPRATIDQLSGLSTRENMIQSIMDPTIHGHSIKTAMVNMQATISIIFCHVFIPFFTNIYPISSAAQIRRESLSSLVDGPDLRIVYASGSNPE